MLRGIRVLTLDNYFAGNYGPMLLAMHGADVVKVEREGSGDVLRRDPPFIEESQNSIGHGDLRLLRGKSSIALDMTTEDGMRTFRELVRNTDVFWTNLRPATLARNGLLYDELKVLNSRLIYAAVSGFGMEDSSESPFRGTLAFDAVIQGAAGLMMRNAGPDGIPQYNGLAIADQVASIYAAFGVLLALQRRHQSGEGAFVDVSMFDSMVALNEKSITLNGMGFPTPPRASATNAPFGAYLASDGWIIIGVGGPTLWERFCAAMNRKDLFDHPDFATGVLRVKNEATLLRPIIEKWLSNMTADQAVDVLRKHDVPVGHVLDVGDDRLLAEGRRRGVIADTELGLSRPYISVQSPIVIDGKTATATRRAPGLGEQQHDVLRRWLGVGSPRSRKTPRT